MTKFGHRRFLPDSDVILQKATLNLYLDAVYADSGQTKRLGKRWLKSHTHKPEGVKVRERPGPSQRN